MISRTLITLVTLLLTAQQPSHRQAASGSPLPRTWQRLGTLELTAQPPVILGELLAGRPDSSWLGPGGRPALVEDSVFVFTSLPPEGPSDAAVLVDCERHVVWINMTYTGENAFERAMQRALMTVGRHSAQPGHPTGSAVFVDPELSTFYIVVQDTKSKLVHATVFTGGCTRQRQQGGG